MKKLVGIFNHNCQQMRLKQLSYWPNTRPVKEATIITDLEDHPQLAIAERLRRAVRRSVADLAIRDWLKGMDRDRELETAIYNKTRQLPIVTPTQEPVRLALFTPEHRRARRDEYPQVQFFEGSYDKARDLVGLSGIPGFGEIHHKQRVTAGTPEFENMLLKIANNYPEAQVREWHGVAGGVFLLVDEKTGYFQDWRQARTEDMVAEIIKASGARAIFIMRPVNKETEVGRKGSVRNYTDKELQQLASGERERRGHLRFFTKRQKPSQSAIELAHQFGFNIYKVFVVVPGVGEERFITQECYTSFSPPIPKKQI